MTTTKPNVGFLLDGKGLPPPLRGHREALYDALAVPLLASWPEDTDLQEARQAERIGNVLIEPLHNDLTSVHIVYLFKETMGSGERIDLGKAKRTSGALAFLTKYDFVLVFNWTAWQKLSGLQRVALVDHELCHCGRDDDGKFVVLHHDVEEFGAIVRRWGFWTSDLETFGRVVKEQLDIFTEDGQ